MQDPFDENNNTTERPKGAEGVIFDIARKAVAGSVRSLLSSEEGLRALIGAMVPKEIGQTIVRELSTQFAALRTEIVRALVAELSAYLGGLDPATEIQRILSGLEFDISVKVGINQKTGKTPEKKPAVKKKKTAKRR
ncbi:MAG: hypothetical protein GXP54_06415 [Deltaproteobacteria bacterium]|nr:hypothetical protein [Deltaproteobacteria bacterium]